MRWWWLATLALPAHAHRPITADGGVFEVDDPTISYLIVSALEHPDDVGQVHLTFDEPFALPFELMVPAIPANAEHRPAFAVVGRGLPKPDAATLTRLPAALQLEDDWGVYVDFNDAPERQIYFEQVMRRNLYTTGAIALSLQEGEVEVWVWSETGSVGPWWLGFGVEEDFSGSAFADIFAEWGKYAY